MITHSDWKKNLQNPRYGPINLLDYLSSAIKAVHDTNAVFTDLSLWKNEDNLFTKDKILGCKLSSH